MSTFSQLVGSSVTGDLYNRALTSAYQPGRRIYDPSLALKSDSEIYNKIRMDAVIEQALSFRRHLIAGQDWNIASTSSDIRDKMLADIIQQLFRHINRFSASMFNLAEAVMRGSAYSYISGERKAIKINGINQQFDWWYPTELKDVDRRRFRQIVEDTVPISNNGSTGERKVKWQIWSYSKGDWIDIPHPEHFVRHIYENSESSLHFGRGLLESLYHYYYFKTQVLEKGLQGIDRWALGIWKVVIDDFRASVKGESDNKEVTQKYIDVIEKLRAYHIIACAKGDDISVQTGGMEGYQMVKEMLEYLDTGMRTLILGANLPTTASEGGSYSLGKVQERSTQSIIAFDRQLLEESISDNLIPLIIKLNIRNFEQLGLINLQQPEFKIMDDELPNPTVRIDVITKALMAGIPLKKEEVYADLGYSIPQEKDDVIIAPKQLPLQMPNI